MTLGLGGEYHKLWLASALSNFSDGLVRAALPLLALQLTSSASIVAVMTMATSLPWLLFALPAGVVVDRTDRRATLWRANGLRVLMLGVIAGLVWTGSITVWMLFAVALALGLLETFSDLGAQTILPLAVGERDLERGNAGLYVAQLTMNDFAGRGAGGALAGLALALPFVAGAAGYLFAAGAFLALRGHYRPNRASHGQPVRQEVADGLRYLFASRALRSLALVTGATNLGMGAASSVLVVYAVSPGPLGLSDAGYGLLLGASGVGGMLGAVVANSVARRLGRLGALALGVPVIALATAAPALTTNIHSVVALTILGGAVGIIWGVISRSLRQQITAGELLGRINAAFQLIGIGLFPVGAAAAAVMARFVSVRTVIAVAGVVVLVGGLAMVGIRDVHLRTPAGRTVS